MKSFLNFIRKNGLYAFINLFGLTVSLAFVLLLAVFVSRQLTTDAFQENADRIYIYANENFIGSAYYLQKHLLDHFPETGTDLLRRQLVLRHILLPSAQRLHRGVEGIRPQCRDKPAFCGHLFSRQGSCRPGIDLQYCRGRGLYVYRGWSYGGYRPFGNQVLRCDVPRR